MSSVQIISQTKTNIATYCALMYDDEGIRKQTLLDAFPCEAVRQGAPVVVCGFCRKEIYQHVRRPPQRA